MTSSRLLSLDNGRVTFRWRDSRHGNQTKSMTLDAVEFIRFPRSMSSYAVRPAWTGSISHAGTESLSRSLDSGSRRSAKCHAWNRKSTGNATVVLAT
jgi:hypothetical protein